jgi:hypothetical protein
MARPSLHDIEEGQPPRFRHSVLQVSTFIARERSNVSHHSILTATNGRLGNLRRRIRRTG